MTSNEPEIIFQNEDFIVVNKPAGLPVHGGGSVRGKTLVDFLLEKFPEIKKVGDEPHFRPGIIHRLDKGTSGIMIVAKNQKSYEELKKLFKQRMVEKKYLALVCGVPEKSSGTIGYPLGRLIKNPTKIGVGKNIKNEREAVTYFRVIKRFSFKTGFPSGDPVLAASKAKPPAGGLALTNFSLLEVMPKTGRMHQIRVHLKSIGHPVACDKSYGGKNVCCPKGLNRIFLHAESLSFSCPEGKRWSFESGLPEELRNALKSIERLQ